MRLVELLELRGAPRVDDVGRGVGDDRQLVQEAREPALVVDRALQQVGRHDLPHPARAAHGAQERAVHERVVAERLADGAGRARAVGEHVEVEELGAVASRRVAGRAVGAREVEELAGVEVDGRLDHVVVQEPRDVVPVAVAQRLGRDDPGPETASKTAMRASRSGSAPARTRSARSVVRRSSSSLARSWVRGAGTSVATVEVCMARVCAAPARNRPLAAPRCDVRHTCGRRVARRLARAPAA
ncbi:hypothetical protein IU11_19450 [Cellulosimicrobium sp. MM]|nr:hypothetical protein IU11_19450 [Cellulosimicrobium sp. MM]